MWFFGRGGPVVPVLRFTGPIGLVTPPLSRPPSATSSTAAAGTSAALRQASASASDLDASASVSARPPRIAPASVEEQRRRGCSRLPCIWALRRRQAARTNARCSFRLDGAAPVALIGAGGVERHQQRFAFAVLDAPAREHAGTQLQVRVGDARARYTARFYIVAMLFVLFDIEVIFLYPVAVHLKTAGTFSFIVVLWSMWTLIRRNPARPR